MIDLFLYRQIVSYSKMDKSDKKLQTYDEGEDPFDDESVFYIHPKKTTHKISDNRPFTPVATPETYTVSNCSTPSCSPDIVHRKHHHPLKLPDGQLDPFVFWIPDEKHYLFSRGRLLLIDNEPTYVIATNYCCDNSHRIMIYYSINNSFEKRFGYYDTSGGFCAVDYFPELYDI